MELKYKSADISNMIDAFSSIQDKKEKHDWVGILEELEKLVEYPTYVLQEFLNCVEALAENNRDENYLKENYLAIMGYIVIRINLVTADNVKWVPEDM